MRVTLKAEKRTKEYDGQAAFAEAYHQALAWSRYWGEHAVTMYVYINFSERGGGFTMRWKCTAEELREQTLYEKARAWLTSRLPGNATHAFLFMLNGVEEADAEAGKAAKLLPYLELYARYA